MNICIVTTFRNQNVGTFFQAYAMQRVLTNFGYHVLFYNIRKPLYSLRRYMFSIGAAALRLNFCFLPIITAQYCSFAKLYKTLYQIKPGKLQKQQIDCYLLGSDVIWDLSVYRTAYNQGAFWGFPFKGSKIISYAASAANTPAELVLQSGLRPGSLDHISSISVRDLHTRNIIQPLTAMPVAIVCDPVLLLKAEDYAAFEQEKPMISSYILIYAFSRLSEKAQSTVKFFAKTTNRKIVSFPYKAHSDADVVIPREPYSFITYYKHADFVITDTFHGCVFSIIFEKQFICIHRKKSKVADLLERLKLSHRLVPDDGDVIDIIQQEIDWKLTEEALAAIYTESFEFLRGALSFDED